jgi:hypothetical protein
MEYQHRYPDWRQPYQRALERVHCNLRETGTLMMHARTGYRRRNVCDQDDVLDTVRDNSSTCTHHISYSTGQLSQRAAWLTVCENKLHLFHVQPVQGLQQGTNISIYIFYGCYTRLYTPLNICAVAGHEGKSLSSVCSGL